MGPNSISWLYLTSFLCLGHSNNISPPSQQPQYLSRYTTADYPHLQKSLTQWRTTMEKSFLRSQDEVGTWNVSDDANETCILLKGIMKLTINYTDISNNTRLSNVDVPPFAKASGSCSAAEQYIILSWQPGNSSQPQSLNNTVTIVFQSNEKSRKADVAAMSRTVPAGKFAIVKVSAVIHKNETAFPNATNPSAPFIIDQDGLVMFPTTLNHSFACDAIITIGSPKEQLTVLLQNSQIEAFRRVARDKTDEGKFNAAEHCAADEISSGSVIVTVILSILCIVLIALGVAVIATYVLKKRRVAVASGYENM